MTARVIALARADASDEALLAACTREDQEALRELFRRHRHAVHRVLGRVLGRSHPSLEDALQLTFLTAWRRADSYAGTATVRAWLFGIASKVALNFSRSDRRRSRFLEAFAVRFRSEPPLIEDVVARGELLERVGEELGALPHDLRVAFILCDVEGLSGIEAASVVGVRPGTIWSRLHHARRCLRSALKRGTS